MKIHFNNILPQMYDCGVVTLKEGIFRSDLWAQYADSNFFHNNPQFF
jgi:hypothetical protein